jgi:DNA polymerase elongation subunit (family B)
MTVPFVLITSIKELANWSRGSFPETSKAPNPVTTICIVTPDRQCIVLATKDLDKPTQSKIQKQIDEHFKEIGDDFSFIFKCFKSEYDMLYTFMDSFVKKFPMMTGWNFVKFDWAYIVNRCKKLGVNYKRLSKVQEVWEKEIRRVQKFLSSILRSISPSASVLFKSKK